MCILRRCLGDGQLIPGTRVHLSFKPAQRGVILARHKTGILVLLDSGPSRYYDESWLVRE